MDGKGFVRVVGIERRGSAGSVVSRAKIGERLLRDVRCVTPVDGDALVRLRDDGGVARDVVIIRALVRAIALARNQAGDGLWFTAVWQPLWLITKLAAEDELSPLRQLDDDVGVFAGEPMIIKRQTSVVALEA